MSKAPERFVTLQEASTASGLSVDLLKRLTDEGLLSIDHDRSGQERVSVRDLASVIAEALMRR